MRQEDVNTVRDALATFEDENSWNAFNRIFEYTIQLDTDYQLLIEIAANAIKKLYKTLERIPKEDDLILVLDELESYAGDGLQLSELGKAIKRVRATLEMP